MLAAPRNAIASQEALQEGLERALGVPVEADVAARLWCHYQLLLPWSSRHSLIGPTEANRLLEDHYAESLRGLDLVRSARRLLDVGSGAGFPGWVLAAALGDTCEVSLVESRSKKAAFLRTAAGRARLACRVVSARVSRLEPPLGIGSVDLVTMRAVRCDRDLLSGLERCLTEDARIVRWEGPAQREKAIGGFARGARVDLPRGRGRIQEWVRGAV